MLCEQTGSAHEDRSLDERLHHIVGLGTYLPEILQKAHHRVVDEAAGQVLRVADNVFAHIAQTAPDSLPPGRHLLDLIAGR